MQYTKVCETRLTFPLTVRSPPKPDLLYVKKLLLKFKELFLTWWCSISLFHPTQHFSFSSSGMCFSNEWIPAVYICHKYTLCKQCPNHGAFTVQSPASGEKICKIFGFSRTVHWEGETQFSMLMNYPFSVANGDPNKSAWGLGTSLKSNLIML